MKLGRVIGNAVSTLKNEAYNGAKIMVVEPVDLELKSAGRTYLAVDMVGAGAGEVVVVVEEGKAAREMLKNPKSPIRTTIIGIVDRVDLSGGGGDQERPTQAAGRTPKARFWSH
jgi:ethanolamine utilization protein EutN